jgi:alginate O-acetyltransferase complex protein AlgI
MVFSSQLFLFAFMPVFFLLYYSFAARWRNWLILAGSIVFYSIGAGSTVVVLLASVALNQYLAIRIHEAREPLRLRLLWAGIVVNLAGLAVYKYTGFAWNLVGGLASGLSLGTMPAAPAIPLPIGISFFTFQAISYLADVYRRAITPAAGYGEFAVYHTLFPQLVAGPIVRYQEIKAELRKRYIDEAALSEGGYRFCLGLGKKIVLADNLGTVADAMFALPPTELSCGQAWLGLLCYSLQIYFDFSGYSDMAIGLGRFLGFHFPENFDQPYRSASVTEFWRRWHMTLSRWFRDYVYISLGGNRRGSLHTYANLWTVFLLCGLWHGAGLTFVIWGIYHGSLLVIERLAKGFVGWHPSGIAGLVVTFLLVTIGWVFFRATSLGQAFDYLQALFGLGAATGGYYSAASYLTSDIVCYLALALFFAFAPFDGWERLRVKSVHTMGIQLTFALCSLAYSALLLAANSFNPFIYFRF